MILRTARHLVRWKARVARIDRSVLPELAEGRDRKLRWYARSKLGGSLPVSVPEAVEMAGDHGAEILRQSRHAVARGEAGADVVIGLARLEAWLVDRARADLGAISAAVEGVSRQAEHLCQLAGYAPAGGDPSYSEAVHELRRQLGNVAAFASSYRGQLDGAASLFGNPPH